MADWKQKLSSFANSTKSKSMELAETAKLNLAISNAEGEIKQFGNRIGEYVLANRLLENEEYLKGIYTRVDELQAIIYANQERIKELKSLKCVHCGAVMEKTVQICPACGKDPRQVYEQPPQPIQQNPAAPQPGNPSYGAPPQPVNPNYGAPQPGNPYYGAPQQQNPNYGAPQPVNPNYGVPPQQGNVDYGAAPQQETPNSNTTPQQETVSPAEQQVAPEADKCSNCGDVWEEGAVFCGNCGAKR